MIVYNVTTKASHDIAENWLTWIRDEHIPDLVSTGCFTHAVILELMEDDEEGKTYAVQYHAAAEKDYRRYIDEYSDEMRKKAIEKWGNKVISFRTVMKVVN